jgi:transposase InsO family protein
MSVAGAYTTLGSGASFGGLRKLKQRVPEASWKHIRDYASTSDTYTRFKAQRRRFPRRPVIARASFEIFSCDLMEMGPLWAKYNRNVRYLLVAVDVLSKYLYVQPVKRKTPVEMIRAFRLIFKHKIPKLLYVDRGIEFYSKKFLQFLEPYGIKVYSTYSSMKSVFAERMIRHLRDKITKVMSETGSRKFLHLLPRIVDEYNSQVHSTTKMAPKDVRPEHDTALIQRLYGGRLRSTQKPRFHVDDQVRVSIQKGLFTKASVQTFSNEVFYIDQVKNTQPITYVLRDEKGERIIGAFYTEELVRVRKTLQDFWPIERIVATQIRNRKKYHKVRFLGYDASEDRWVPASELKKYQTIQ